MTAIFIHGVPDTHHVWDPVRRCLAGATKTEAWDLPGFGAAPLPAGFTATKEEYVQWLIARLEAQSEPVHLVAHDWGCLLVMRVASLRPDLVRTWAAGSGPVSADFVWHPLAKIWQTPGAGEAWMANLDATGFASQLTDLGVPPELAREAATRINPRMKECILRLYRSALHVGAEWQPGLANVRSPGLVLWGALDQACPVGFADQLGRDAHARRVLKFAGCGHWWPLQWPDETAAALRAHWQTREQP